MSPSRRAPLSPRFDALIDGAAIFVCAPSHNQVIEAPRGVVVLLTPSDLARSLSIRRQVAPDCPDCAANILGDQEHVPPRLIKRWDGHVPVGHDVLRRSARLAPGREDDLGSVQRIAIPIAVLGHSTARASKDAV
jgi:hypothetical protein